ncbi:uncharacterized protein LOC105842946 [Bombyx mori]|uniref:Endonuclease/exonuclease/phosphatase domain-containing protein n=1 Tax=Bombyx mori TaxID=7091 RepID=A0A8R2GDF3_BOMMO|nr:uncharacterized protein LOC105842946 [Bombyx mori]
MVVVYSPTSTSEEATCDEFYSNLEGVLSEIPNREITMHHPRRLYAWISPDDRCRNQIDYILISSRWRSSITNVKTFPGADCGSDHSLLVAKFALRLKAIKKKCLKPMCMLTPAEQKQVQCPLDEAIVQTSPLANLDSDEQWRHLKDQINETFEKVSNKHPLKPCPKQTWMSDKTLKLIQDRKELRSRGLSDPADRVKYS